MFSKNILYFIFEKKKQFLIAKRIFKFFSSLKNRKLFLKTAIKHTLNFFQKYFLSHDS